MGVGIRTLLSHLRERQEKLGVRAFHFQHVLRNNVVESACYPDSAQSILDSEDPVEHVEVSSVNTPKVEAPVKVPATKEAKQRIPVPSTTVSPEQHSKPVPPPGWTQMPGPNYWPAHFMSAIHSNPVPTFPFPYQPYLMPQWGGPPGWGPPPAPSVERSLHTPDQTANGFLAPAGATPGIPVPSSPFPADFRHPQPIPPVEQFPQIHGQPVNGFHAPGAAGATPGIPVPSSPFPADFMHPQPIPPVEQFPQIPGQPVNGFHGPGAAPVLQTPVSQPFCPLSQFNDPHPMPSGEPPFAKFYPCVPLDQFRNDCSVTTPTKKPLPKTPKKTPGKRKREDHEDTPSNKPTRSSNRTRTPKKIFEIE